MTIKRAMASLSLASFLTATVGLLSGCEAGSGQIPLANVPPPPPGFAASNKDSKLPGGASPADANARRQ